METLIRMVAGRASRRRRPVTSGDIPDATPISTYSRNISSLRQSSTHEAEPVPSTSGALKTLDKPIPGLDDPVPGPSEWADTYSMDHDSRGKVIVFNHKKYKKRTPRSREGTEIDVETVTDTFRGLKFHVDTYEDYKKKQIFEKLEEVAAHPSLWESDCLVVVVMSHGKPDGIWAKDKMYDSRKLWQNFLPGKCSALIGKPKIFIIQACRGVKHDAGRRVKRDTADDDDKTYYRIPSTADILIYYATSPDYGALRSLTEGAYFINALCLELKQRWSEEDILSILTAVNLRVAITVNSDLGKQMPMFVSTLTRKLIINSSLK